MTDSARLRLRMLSSICALAIVTFGASAVFVGPPTIVADGLSYNASAARLINTGVYSYPSLDINNPGSPNAFVTPGYPWLLALGYLFLPHSGDVAQVIARAIPWIVTLNFVAALGAVLTTAISGELLGGRRLGWAAGLASVAYLPFGAESMSGWSENVSLFITAMLLLLAVRLIQADEDAALARSAHLGLFGGAATLVRPVFALWFIVPLALFLWLNRSLVRRALLVVLVGMGCAMLALSPWVLRNAVVLGRFIPLTEHAGTVWIDGVGGVALSDEEQAVFAEAIREGRDGYRVVAFDRLRSMWADDPIAVVKWRMSGVWHMLTVPWSSREDPHDPLPPNVPRIDGRGYRLMSIPAYDAWRFITQLLHGSALLLALTALVARRRQWFVWLAASVPAYFLAIGGLMAPLTRYFYPTMPAVLLLAGAGVITLLHARDGRINEATRPRPV